MKKTILFSNVIGDVTSKTNTIIRFNQYMEDYLKENINDSPKLLFINAPGLGNEENYLDNIIKCFENININFQEVFDLELNEYINKVIINSKNKSREFSFSNLNKAKIELSSNQINNMCFLMSTIIYKVFAIDQLLKSGV